MLIFEVENSGKIDTGKLLALIKFLAGRADDTNAKKQISTKSFIKLAQRNGVNITSDILGNIISQEPLSNVVEPYEPNSNVIKFKGNNEPSNTVMNTDKAEKIVNQNAKTAMKRGMSK